MTKPLLRADGMDPIALRTRRLIEDVTAAAACHGADLTEFAGQVLAGRRQRSRFFDPALFSNPAWDILLSLFVARGEGRAAATIEELGIADIPRSVILRWLQYLRGEAMVLLVGQTDRPQHARWQLADTAAASIDAYLASLLTLGLGPEPGTSDTLPAGD